MSTVFTIWPCAGSNFGVLTVRTKRSRVEVDAASGLIFQRYRFRYWIFFLTLTGVGYFRLYIWFTISTVRRALLFGLAPIEKA